METNNKVRGSTDEREVVVEVRNVTKIYRIGTERIVALDGVSLKIYKGEFCCLLGTSGSGKSTLLNAMAGIEKITKGQIFIKGKPIHRMSETQLALFRQKNLGFVFQSYNLINSMTALENVTLPLIFKNVSKGVRIKKAKKMLEEVGLKKRMRHRPSQMSGGQQQRVGIARAFVANPDVVFADEPTGNLDSKTTSEILALMKKISEENDKTIIVVTHDQSLTDYADRVIRIHDGQIINVSERGADGALCVVEENKQQEEKV